MNRMMFAFAGAVLMVTPAVASGRDAGPAPVGASSSFQVAQAMYRDTYREDVRPGWRSERRMRRDRRWDGYTGQVCRTRVVYRLTPYGERVRRVIRTCS